MKTPECWFVNFWSKKPKNDPKNTWANFITHRNSLEITDNSILLKGNEWPCSGISKSTQKCCHIRRVNTFKLPKLFYYQLILFLKAFVWLYHCTLWPRIFSLSKYDAYTLYTVSHIRSRIKKLKFELDSKIDPWAKLNFGLNC